MDRRILIVVIASIAAAAFFWLRREEPIEEADAAPSVREVAKSGPAKAREPALAPVNAPQQQLPSRIQSSVTPGMVIQKTDPAAIVARGPDTPGGHPVREDAAKAEADTLALNLREYGHRFGGNPSGTNAEIAKALIGNNPKSVRFLSPELSRLNDKGELIDRWGTPYFFHQLSKDHTEVRSAGPDRQMWTGDDLVE